MTEPTTLALDAMGSDRGPEVVVPGAALSADRHPALRFVLVGDQARIEPCLASHPALRQRSRVVHTSLAVGMHDKPSQALRRGRVSLPSQIYLLTTVTHGWAPIFLNADLAVNTCRRIGDASLWRNARLLCWVLMPDHVHWLLQMGRGMPMEQVVARMKSASR